LRVGERAEVRVGRRELHDEAVICDLAYLHVALGVAPSDQRSSHCWVSVGARTPVLGPGAPQAWVERIPEGVAQEVEGEDRREDRDARPDAHPPLQVGEVAL